MLLHLFNFTSNFSTPPNSTSLLKLKLRRYPQCLHFYIFILNIYKYNCSSENECIYTYSFDCAIMIIMIIQTKPVQRSVFQSSFRIRDHLNEKSEFCFSLNKLNLTSAVGHYAHWVYTDGYLSRDL